MRVGIVTSHMSMDEHGGAVYSRHLLGQQLEQRGHDVTIYTLNFSEPENHIPVPHDYDLVKTQIDSWTIVDGVARFYRQIGRYFEESDLIHVYVPGIIPLVGAYRKATGDETPIIGTLNGYTPFCSDTAGMGDGCWKNCTLAKKLRHSKRNVGDFTPDNLPRMAFNNYATVPLMNQFDRLFCLSPAVRSIYRDIGVRDEILDVVPNMVDPEFSQPAAADGGRPDPDGDVRLLYVGRVDVMKSIGNLLEAVSRMETDGWHLDVVGDNILDYGQGLEGYKQDARELGIDDKVTWHGWVDYHDLSDYYARADAFVHAAEWPEPFGRTIIEAMEHGLPVVCSNVGAPPWIAGSAGLSYPKEDPQTLAATLDSLVATPERREALAANTTIELERFETQRVMDDLEATYEEVMA